MRRYCKEIAPLVRSARFYSVGSRHGGGELRTASSRTAVGQRDGREGGDDNVEDLISGFGVVVAAETAIGSLEGITFPTEGFGKVGGTVAREVVRRDASVVAISAMQGVVCEPSGLDVELLSRFDTRTVMPSLNASAGGPTPIPRRSSTSRLTDSSRARAPV